MFRLSYQRVPENGDEEILIDKSNYFSKWFKNSAFVINIAVLVINTVIVLVLLIRHQSNSTVFCTENLSTWSPALPVVWYEKWMFDGAIDGSNQYRGTPSKEIDDAWRRISVSTPGVRIYADELLLLNKSITDKAYHAIPQEFGGGYLAMTEVFHLLHCLDALRKAIYPSFYPLRDGENATKVRIHTDHCIDLLRQHIMCTGDVGPVLFYDDAAHKLPQPDFSTVRKCRNFDAILEWAYTNERRLEWDSVGLPM